MKIFVLIITVFTFINVSAQLDILVSDADFTTSGQGLCDCGTDFSYVDSLNFHDTGGESANYSPNEDEVITFCPDINGNKVSAAFGNGGTGFTFDVDPSDTIFIHDGPSISDPILDTLNNNLQPVGTITASLTNLSGCLTIHFVSDGANEGTGWDANISCGNQAQPFSIGIEGFINGQANGANDNVNDVMPVDTGYIDVCLGDSVLLKVDGYFPYEPGGDSSATFGGGYNQSNNYTVEWTVSNGIISSQDSIWVVPPAQQGYFVSLQVTDALGMSMYATCKIRVSTTPSFATCQALDPQICLGQQTLLFGGVTATDTVGVEPTTASFPIGGEFGTATFLPDGDGAAYQTDIDITGYTQGATIVAGTDIQQICVSMEHTWLGDLEMWLTCPNGTEVTIFNSNAGGYIPGGFGGGGDYVGGGNDNSSAVGNCEEYCFTEANGVWPSWDQGYNTVTASGPTTGQMVEPGAYNPEGTFADFVGCPINGTWTLNVQDNILADDGWICQWGIYFLDSLNPSNEYYTTEIVDEYWHSDPTIIQDSNNDTTIVIEPDSVGFFSYTFEVLDNFGCTYDTTIQVEAIAGPTINPVSSACLGNWIDFSGTFAPQGGTWWSEGPGPLNFNPSNTDNNPSIFAIEGGQYTLYFADNQCGDTISTTAWFLEDPTVDILYEGSDTVTHIYICTDDQITLTTMITNDSSSIWNMPNGNRDSIVVNGQILAGTGTDFPFVMNVSGVCGEVSDQVIVTVEDCAIPNVITPNGDGMNEFFYTNYAEHYDDVELIIYNRWGTVVYKTESYANDWHGQKMDGNKQVADGTYFYIMRWDGGTKDAAGTITLFESK